MQFVNKKREKKYSMEMNLGQKLHIIEKTLVEKDPGLIISNDLKWVNQECHLISKIKKSSELETVLTLALS